MTGPRSKTMNIWADQSAGGQWWQALGLLASLTTESTDRPQLMTVTITSDGVPPYQQMMDSFNFRGWYASQGSLLSWAGQKQERLEVTKDEQIARWCCHNNQEKYRRRFIFQERPGRLTGTVGLDPGNVIRTIREPLMFLQEHGWVLQGAHRAYRRTGGRSYPPPAKFLFAYTFISIPHYYTL